MPRVAITFRQFLMAPDCPSEWLPMDLYLFRDDEVVFYVGQSAVAYRRIWEHLTGGYKGRSMAGRFLLCNWPSSLRYTIELVCSKDDEFFSFGGDLNAAERGLIERYRPCFNEALNGNPTPLPIHYAPPNATILGPRSVNRLVSDARDLARAKERREAAMDFYGGD
jgi:hypothetical protein